MIELIKPKQYHFDMEKCEVCGKDWDIKIGDHCYCAVHYVENENEECLYWDLNQNSTGL